MPKRVYIGNDMWETRHPNGGSEFEMAFSPSELAILEDAAARAGVTVNQLVKNRLLGRSDNATTPD
jgi:hypothetical protein